MAKSKSKRFNLDFFENFETVKTTDKKVSKKICSQCKETPLSAYQIRNDYVCNYCADKNEGIGFGLGEY
jgi:formylmethanofuran dehydrogenase subunit E